MIFVNLSLLLLTSPIMAASIAVNSTTCTLADAINAANANVAVNGCSAGNNGADTLNLVVNSTHHLSAVDNTFADASGLPVISSTILIEGNGSMIARLPTVPEFRIFTINGKGNLTLKQLTVSGGLLSGSGDGGGIYNLGTLSFINSTISSNRANNGGGIMNNGSLSLDSSTLVGNSALAGGGVYNATAGRANVINSTFSGNSASIGGGLLNSGTISLQYVTLSRNSANTGGGIINNFGSIILANNLIAGNTAALGAELDLTGGSITSVAPNLLGHNELTFAQAFNNYTPGISDVTVVASPYGIRPTPLRAILEPLSNNGGLTQTHTLVADSPAIDAAGSCSLMNDERGILRPQGSSCDIGAVERVNTQPPVTTCTDLGVTLSGSQVPPVNAALVTYQLQIDLQNKCKGFRWNKFIAQMFQVEYIQPPRKGILLVNAKNGPKGVDGKVVTRVTALPGGIINLGETLKQALIFSLPRAARAKVVFNVYGFQETPWYATTKRLDRYLLSQVMLVINAQGKILRDVFIKVPGGA